MLARSSSFTKIFLCAATASLFGFPACSGSSSQAQADGGVQSGTDASSGDDGTAADAEGGEAFDANGPHATIRVMTGNLTSGNNQNYDSGEGARIFAGLHADVILIQEFQVGTTEADAQTFVETVCGAGCSYFRQAGVNIPNGVITKFPIISSGIWDDPNTAAGDRDFAWAQIDVPGPHDLWAVSVHLLTSSGTNRNNQATSIVGYVQANVPSDAYLVIGGDFNTDTRDEAAIGTLSGVVDIDAPYPADNLMNESTNAPRNKPYDWVVGSPNLAAGLTPVKIGSQAFGAGLVVDTRVYTPIEDIAPAMTTDSAATNMQHMAVVRDFLIAD